MRRWHLAEVTQPEIDSIRAAQADFMPSVGVIRRPKFQGDGDYSAQTIYEDVACRIMPGPGRWTDAAEKYQGITPYRITFAHDQDIKAGDTVVDDVGRTFQIRDVMAASSYQTAVQCLADRVGD